MHLWELASGSCVRGFAGHADTVTSLALSGGLVLSGSRDGTLRLWDLANGECLRVLKGHEDGVTCLALTQDASLAVAAASSGHLHVWDLATGERLRSHPAVGVTALTLTPDGKTALTGPTFQLWDIKSGTPRPFPGKAPEASAVALTPDGRYALGTAPPNPEEADDHPLHLWSLSDGAPVARLAGHTAPVHSLALTADGRVAFSASADGSVRIWDAATGTGLHAIVGHEGPVLGVDATPDGRFVISAGADQTLRLWELDWELNPDGQSLSLAEALRKPGLLDRVLFWKKRT